jgi:hypothetical protein
MRPTHPVAAPRVREKMCCLDAESGNPVSRAALLIVTSGTSMLEQDN